eukprot:jgi/Psemu1/200246/e_gw1.253.58.1
MDFEYTDEYLSALLLGTNDHNHHHEAALADRPSNRKFLSDLRLPAVHPFCLGLEGVGGGADFFIDPSIPPMGSLNLAEEIWTAAVTTLWFMVAPALLAMGELWLRLFAGWIGPLGIVWLVLSAEPDPEPPVVGANTRTKTKSESTFSFYKCLGIVLTVASSLVLMTDTLYVLQNGTVYGAVLFAASLALLFHFGHPADDVRIAEGLYHDPGNPLVSRIAERWKLEDRVYDTEHGATPWMTTGDSRTGLPFILHHHPIEDRPIWNRVFLEVKDETGGSDPVSEFVALDVAFPKTPTGHDPTKPIYLVLHGLGGGSTEEYIRDLVIRRNAEGSTVVVMIARGLMDTPIRGNRIFHGARTSDAHAAAKALRRALQLQQQQLLLPNQNQNRNQLLVGVGYSMGAIVLANYVASYGPECALDAAVAVSGGLDMRYQTYAYRTQRLWQPILAGNLRSDFLLGKFGHRVKKILSPANYLRVLRASHITEIDEYAVVPFNGFDDLDHYYREMSALGDIPHDPSTGLPPADANERNLGKIQSVSIPFLVVHALDDPLVTWRASVHNEGFMHPANLSRSGSGHLMILLTKAGGHVGWPLGTWPTKHKWKWMSDLVSTFAKSVDDCKRQ